GEGEKAEALVREAALMRRVDPATGAVEWEIGGGHWWDWDRDPVETSAAVLQAYLALRPAGAGDELPQALLRWLVENRLGSRWTSTRQTALPALALASYHRASGELRAENGVDVDQAGQAQRYCTIDRENRLTF